MAYIAVERPDGNQGIGSAFHIGDGVFVTARHVVDGNRLLKVKTTEPVAIGAAEFFPDMPETRIEEYNQALRPVLGYDPMFKHWPKEFDVETGPLFCDDPGIDLAIFKVKDIHHAVPSVLLGVHFDDWIYRYPWQLSEAIVLGYPPIPLTNEPHLVAARAEIHTFVALRGSRNVHFILSATPRDGFSGGLALHEGGVALGVILGGLVQDNQPTELGYYSLTES
jgi:hypothetical protein